MAEHHHAHMVVMVDVGVEHAHVGVGAGDEVLDDQLGAVAGAVDRGDDMGQLLGRVQDERLLASGEVHVQVFDAVRRLDGHGEAERQVVMLAGRGTGLVQNERERVRQVILGAQLVEGGLVAQTVVQVGIDRHEREIRLQLVLVPAQQLAVVVTARDEQERGVGSLGREPATGLDHVTAEGFRLGEVREERRLHNRTEFGDGKLHTAVYQRFQAIRAVERAGHRVGAGFTAE